MGGRFDALGLTRQSWKLLEVEYKPRSSQRLSISSQKLPEVEYKLPEAPMQVLPEVEYKLPDAPVGCEIAPKVAVGGSQLLKMSSQRLLEVDNKLPPASRRLQNRLSAYSCSEINAFRGYR